MAAVVKSVLDGSVKSSFLLLEDSISLNARPVLKAVINQLSAKFDSLHILLNEVSSTEYRDISNRNPGKVKLQDCSTDLLGWNGSLVNLTTDLYSTLSAGVTQGAGSVLLVVDSLSVLTEQQSVSTVCRSIHQLYKLHTEQTVCIVGLLHADLHDDHALTLLHHTATSIFTLDVPNQNQFHALGHLIHKKESGKITNIKTHLCVSDDLSRIETICEYKPIVGNSDTADDSSVDPAANLTFNLTLNENERVARSNLKLPYMHAGTDTAAGSGKIFYQPDEADDFDEGDPDDDLDI